MKRILWILFLIAGQSVLAGDIVINEIMYHSVGTEVEFVELYNATGSDVNVQDWTILDDNDGHKPCKLSGTIPAGGYLIVTGNLTQFTARYPGVSPVNTNVYDTGSEAWSLGNAGDAVRLYDAAKVLQDIVVYEDGGDWPASADGNGPSLELLNPAMDNNNPSSWDPSTGNGGTPGRINSAYTENAAPIARDGTRLTALPTAADAVVVTVQAFDIEGLASVSLLVNTGSGYISTPMNDNGSGGDAAAGDSMYSAVIPAQPGGTLVKYYALATDAVGQTDTWPNQAPASYEAYTVGYKPPKLRVTEALAVNGHVNQDNSGEYDDWIEIHNEDAATVNIGGMFISSSVNSPQMFQLPSRNLAPDEYLIIWADDDTQQGNLHADFKLSSEGEDVALFETIDHGNVLIHGWKFGRMSEDISMGFKPMDATAPEYLKNPTPGASNETSELFSPVCINEFQSTSNFGGTDDWVEIFNRGSAPFDLTGCYLSDERGENTKWKFPGKIIQPGEYLVIYEDVLDFGFSSEGQDVIMLSAADSLTGLDFYDFGPQTADKSEGRSTDGVAYWTKFDNPTRGSANISSCVDCGEPAAVPEDLVLYANYPNPFNPVTTLSFYVPKTEKIILKIFDASGRETAMLADGVFQRGRHDLTWNAEGRTTGVYFFSVQGAGFRKTGKMLLIR
ncbi:lamin tail domain-containing protein [bacterium]|nr:lamin tail domain-containing protein [bacterium]